MILQAANSGGVTPFERNNDAQAFLFDPFLQVAQLTLKLAPLGFISFALHVAPALVVFLLPFIWPSISFALVKQATENHSDH